MRTQDMRVIDEYGACWAGAVKLQSLFRARAAVRKTEVRARTRAVLRCFAQCRARAGGPPIEIAELDRAAATGYLPRSSCTAVRIRSGAGAVVSVRDFTGTPLSSE